MEVGQLGTDIENGKGENNNKKKKKLPTFLSRLQGLDLLACTK